MDVARCIDANFVNTDHVGRFVEIGIERKGIIYSASMAM